MICALTMLYNMAVLFQLRINLENLGHTSDTISSHIQPVVFGFSAEDAIDAFFLFRLFSP